MSQDAQDKVVLGWREWLNLRDLGLNIKAKVDTGARTSALHTFGIETFQESDELWVRFNMHPLQYSTDKVVTCEARVVDTRPITDSGGHTENRYVIETTLEVAGRTWPIEVSLTSRDNMRFRMLLGRTAINGRALVDPQKSYLLGRNKAPKES